MTTIKGPQGRVRFLQPVLTLVTVLAALPVFAACSMSNLAVDRMSSDQVQATAFLPLNEDNPGATVDATRYLANGKYTIVAYYSPYSPPYVNFSPGLARLVQSRGDFAVRTVNVNRPGVQGIDYQSPIMKQLELNTLPYFQIYDPYGRLRAHGRPAYEQVRQWVR